MAIKDSITNLKKGLRTTLTNVPALIDTLIRGLDGVAEAAEEESTYSTTERVIGKWTDGSELYEIVVDFGTLPKTSGKILEIEALANANVITYNGIAKDNLGNTIPIPYVSTTNSAIVTYIGQNNKLYVITENDRSAFNGIFIFRYTKNTANRAPENNAKNGSEENEEVKNEK